MQEQVQSLQQSIKIDVFTIVFPAKLDDPLDKLTKVVAELKISEARLKKTHDDLVMVREKLSLKERKSNIENENSNYLTSKYKETKDEIKELETKLKRNISLTKARKIVWNSVIQ